MTTFQVASDLHIEYNEESDSPDPLKYITPSADTLILGGDIGSLYRHQQLSFFLKELGNHFGVIIYVPGNHEWYAPANGDPIPLRILEERMESIENSIENLYILNGSSVRFGNVCITGATLWTNPDCGVPPFIVRIPELRTSEYRRRHFQDLRYIKNMIEHCRCKNYKLVVVTHHPPSFAVMQANDKRKKFRSLYATDLEHLLKKDNVNTWISGHVHKNFDFITEQGTRLLSNQKGKPKDKTKGYSKAFVISL